MELHFKSMAMQFSIFYVATNVPNHDLASWLGWCMFAEQANVPYQAGVCMFEEQATNVP